MTAKPTTTNFWWLKKSKTDSNLAKSEEAVTEFLPSETKLTTSLAEFLEKENEVDYGAGGDQGDVDIDTILEEINRIAAQSPLGPFEKITGERSVEDLMKEAEKIYNESSKSFEQLSQHSATSHNISEELNTQSSLSTPAQSPIPFITENDDIQRHGTPTPKSISPTLENNEENKNNGDDYSDDFSENKSENTHDPSLNGNSDDDISNSIASLISPVSPKKNDNSIARPIIETSDVIIRNNVSLTELTIKDINNDDNEKTDGIKSVNTIDNEIEPSIIQIPQQQKDTIKENFKEIEHVRKEVLKKDSIIEHLIEENKCLKEDMKELQCQLEETISLLEQAKNALKSQPMKSPEINIELEKALEQIKDTKEVNTALQLQLDGVNSSYQLLKISYDELQATNKTIDRKFSELDGNLSKYKSDLLTLQQQRDKLQENETSLNKLLEIERLQVKSLKLQTEKDARCIMDLNRQIKEMERIIARKHPDSVSALIVAAKNDVSETNITAKRFLEDRIKVLEIEAQKRDAQNSKVFIDVQEKFNQMKLKYESHIEDLELHVNDLKNQLKHRSDTYDVYTQTIYEDLNFPEKETISAAVQTDAPLQQKNVIQKVGCVKRLEKIIDTKEETHLLATIRGLQTDLSNKEKVIAKLQREMEDLRKTNRRLQKEREGSLRNLSDRREFRSYPDKLANQLRQDTSGVDVNEKSLDEELRNIKSERDKMKLQLCRMEEDYQKLKAKRIQDLNILQEAHEKEISTYLTNITPLREQLEIQQISLSSLQKQLSTAKEELAIVTVERDHLNNKLQFSSEIIQFENSNKGGDEKDINALQKKICYLEKRYEEREHRLRAIVHGLAQKNLSNLTCEQCAARQQQLIGYKAELDQLIATLKSLQ